MKIRSIILFTSIIILFSSCSSVFNGERKTARKGNVYPKFTEADTLRGKLSPIRDCYDVLHYYIKLDVNPEKKYLLGYVDITFRAVSTFSTMQIDLFENMKIDSIVVDNSKLSYTRKLNAVFVSTGKIQEKSQKTMRVYYQGKPIIAKRPPWEGGFVWEKSKDGKPWIGVACELTGASLWWPCKDHLSDEPEQGVTIDITAPKGLTIVSNGVKVLEEQTETHAHVIWKTNYSINNYNVSIYIGNYTHWTEEFNGADTSYTLSYYVLPEYLEKSKKQFTQTAPIIKAYEEIFGAYPWPKDGFKLIGSPYEGMEHQTAIAYGTGFRTLFYGIDYIILHEAAHEWWGNSVSAPDVSDIFIHEGFATYAEWLYVEKIYGKNKVIPYQNYYNYFIKNKNPIVGPSDVNFWNYKDTDPYLKGAWTLHSLRHLINNDSLFFSMIQKFYAQQKYKITTVKDFIGFVNTTTNSDYTWFFNQFLYSHKAPKLEYIFENKNNAIVFYIRWVDTHADFKLPITVIIDNKPVRIIPTKEIQEFVFPNAQTASFNPNEAYYALKQVKKFK